MITYSHKNGFIFSTLRILVRAEALDITLKSMEKSQHNTVLLTILLCMYGYNLLM